MNNLLTAFALHRVSAALPAWSAIRILLRESQNRVILFKSHALNTYPIPSIHKRINPTRRC